MYLHVNTTALYYQDMGQGCPILCLHAFPVDGSVWRRQSPLSAHARLIIPDLRGMGNSQTDGQLAAMDRLAADMIVLLDHLGIERAVVMGLSLGGYVALALYRNAPARVRGLILADTRAEADAPDARERRLCMADKLTAGDLSPVLNILPNLFGASTKREHAELLEAESRRLAEGNALGLAMIQRGMAERPDATAMLSKIAVPTLALCGVEDTVSPPESMRVMVTRIPGAELHLIPQAGHLAPLENPDAFNREVEQFIEQISCA